MTAWWVRSFCFADGLYLCMFQENFVGWDHMTMGWLWFQSCTTSHDTNIFFRLCKYPFIQEHCSGFDTEKHREYLDPRMDLIHRCAKAPHQFLFLVDKSSPQPPAAFSHTLFSLQTYTTQYTVDLQQSSDLLHGPENHLSASGAWGLLKWLGIATSTTWTALNQWIGIPLGC